MYQLKQRLHGAEIQALELEAGREYTFGRAETCDVQLKEGSGISRTHFKLSEEGGQWQASVVSKFGDILQSGRPVQTIPLEPGTSFQLGPYDFLFVEAKQEEFAPPSNIIPLPLAPADPLLAPPALIEPAADFEGNDEATKVVMSQPESPFIRIVESNGQSESIKLEGRRWFAGREEGSHIPLNDRKASRRQFEISSSAQGYFIRDLGSANGTLLNGTALATDEIRSIRSGDVIQVGALTMYFEVRDPTFDNKLMVISPDVRSEGGIVVQAPYEMINYPVIQGPGGAIRVDGGGDWLSGADRMPLPFGESVGTKKKRQNRILLLIAIVASLAVAGIVIFPSKDKPAKVAKVNSAFEKLSPKQQQQVKDLYVLAHNLYMQNRLALAAAEFEKIHAIIPEGYLQSLAMANECAQQADLDRQLREIEEQKRRQEEIRRTVEKAIKDCEPLSRRTFAQEEITNCLKPAIELDPENSRVVEQISRVRARFEERERREVDRKARQVQVAKGRALYDKAFLLEQQGEYLEALEAYRKHVNSSYPDPDGLKGVSQKQILVITKATASKVEDSLRAAEAAYGVNNYKETFEHIAKAKKLDPRNARTAEMNARYRKELNLKLREIYEESVISEGLGQVDDAKARWKKIIEMDSSDGEYFIKARNKLKNYGAF